MKMKIRLLAIFFLICSISIYADERKAADFTLKDLSGKEVSLSDYKNKIVLLNFWATWCPPCINEMPDLERIYQNYKDKDVQLLGMTVSSKLSQIPKLVKSTGVTYPILVNADDVVADYGGFNSIPQTFIIDQDGNIVKQITGGRDYDGFEREIKPLLK
jgi:thiol-disulfide isomerase/thioredoxin